MERLGGKVAKTRGGLLLKLATQRGINESLLVPKKPQLQFCQYYDLEVRKFVCHLPFMRISRRYRATPLHDFVNIKV